MDFINYTCFYIKDSDKNELNKVINEIVKLIIKLLCIGEFHISPDTINVKRDELDILDLILHQKKENSLAKKFPHLINKWHKTKNKSLTPYNVKAHSNKKVWWICNNNHEYQRQICEETQIQKCPICSHNKHSLANVKPEIAMEWHPTKNVPLTANSIAAHSGKKVWWICNNNHEFEMTVKNRRKAGFCPFCHGSETSEENSLSALFPNIAQEWNHKKNEGLTPMKVKPFSNKRVWWICEKGHSWQNTINNRTRKKSNCPTCRKKKMY